MSVTKNLEDFGFRELKEAGKLLTAYGSAEDNTRHLGEGVHICFNHQSGYVFLSDEDYNVAILNGDILEDFLTCPECGFEEADSNFEVGCVDDCCRTYYQEMKG